MRSVTVTCPQCSQSFEFDVKADINTCSHCGFIIDIDEETVRDKELRDLEQKLRTQLRKKYDSAAITEICNTVIGHDVHNSDAWIYKGMASEDLSEKLSCYCYGVRYMDTKEFADIYNTLSEEVATLLVRYDKEWDPLDVAWLDFEFRKVKPEHSRKDDFILDVMNRLKNRAMMMETTYTVKSAFSAFLSLTIAFMMLHQDITVQAGTLESAVADMDEIIRKFGHERPEPEKGYENDKVELFLRNGSRYAEMILNDLNNEIKSMTEEDVEEREISWNEEEIAPVVGTLLEGLELNESVFDGDVKDQDIRNEQKEIIGSYVYEYFTANNPEDEEPEPEEEFIPDPKPKKKEESVNEVPKVKSDEPEEKEEKHTYVVYSRSNMPPSSAPETAAKTGFLASLFAKKEKQDLTISSESTKEEETVTGSEDDTGENAAKTGFVASLFAKKEKRDLTVNYEHQYPDIPPVEDQDEEVEEEEKKGFFSSIKERFAKNETQEETVEEEIDDETEEEDTVEEEKKGFFSSLKERFTKKEAEEETVDEETVEEKTEEKRSVAEILKERFSSDDFEDTRTDDGIIYIKSDEEGPRPKCREEEFREEQEKKEAEGEKTGFFDKLFKKSKKE